MCLGILTDNFITSRICDFILFFDSIKHRKINKFKNHLYITPNV